MVDLVLEQDSVTRLQRDPVDRRDPRSARRNVAITGRAVRRCSCCRYVIEPIAHGRTSNLLTLKNLALEKARNPK
jgi:hypothetical protein